MSFVGIENDHIEGQSYLDHTNWNMGQEFRWDSQAIHQNVLRVFDRVGSYVWDDNDPWTRSHCANFVSSTMVAGQPITISLIDFDVVVQMEMLQ